MYAMHMQRHEDSAIFDPAVLRCGFSHSTYSYKSAITVQG